MASKTFPKNTKIISKNIQFKKTFSSWHIEVIVQFRLNAVDNVRIAEQKRTETS